MNTVTQDSTAIISKFKMNVQLFKSRPFESRIETGKINNARMLFIHQQTREIVTGNIENITIASSPLLC